MSCVDFCGRLPPFNYLLVHPIHPEQQPPTYPNNTTTKQIPHACQGQPPAHVQLRRPARREQGVLRGNLFFWRSHTHARMHAPMHARVSCRVSGGIADGGRSFWAANVKTSIHDRPVASQKHLKINTPLKNTHPQHRTTTPWSGSPPSASSTRPTSCRACPRAATRAPSSTTTLGGPSSSPRCVRACVCLQGGGCTTHFANVCAHTRARVRRRHHHRRRCQPRPIYLSSHKTQMDT